MLKRFTIAAFATLSVTTSLAPTDASSAGRCVRFISRGYHTTMINNCGTFIRIRLCYRSANRKHSCRYRRYAGYDLEAGQAANVGGRNFYIYYCRGRHMMPVGRPPTRCRRISGRISGRSRGRAGICPPTWRVARNRLGNTVCSCRGNYTGPSYTWQYYRQGSRCRW